MSLTDDELLVTLKYAFGLDAFRPGQIDAIRATLSGRDSLVIMPTGGGKSMCYQFPPMTREHGFTIVVSPLISLQRDQVEKALEYGMDAQMYNSDVSMEKKASLLRDMVSDEPSIRLIFTTPESLQQESFKEALQLAIEAGMLISWAIDEAHCLSEWGNDFRPAYLSLSGLKAFAPGIPISCFTASATSQVQDQIVSILGLKKDRVLIKLSFNRPNIRYDMRYKALVGKDGSEEAVMEDLARFIKGRPGESGIIYCRLRLTCDKVAKALEMEEIDVAVYHAGLDQTRRNKVQSEWSCGGIQVIVATVAFGMGVDRSDVRWVVHFNSSGSLEGFYQESGRAGRDGWPCLSLVYASRPELEEVGKMEKGNRRGSAQEVASFLFEGGCRRRKILSFFGERRPGGCDPSSGEEACDFCRDPKAVVTMIKDSMESEKRRNEGGVNMKHTVEEDVKEGGGGGGGGGGTSDGLKRPFSCSWTSALEMNKRVQAGPSAPPPPPPPSPLPSPQDYPQVEERIILPIPTLTPSIINVLHVFPPPVNQKPVIVSRRGSIEEKENQPMPVFKVSGLRKSFKPPIVEKD